MSKFLNKGIHVNGDTLSKFFKHNREILENIRPIIEVEGKKYPFQKFLETDIFSDEVFLTIESTWQSIRRRWAEKSPDGRRPWVCQYPWHERRLRK